MGRLCCVTIVLLTFTERIASEIGWIICTLQGGSAHYWQRMGQASAFKAARKQALTWLQLPAADLVRALDPCSWKGEALVYLAHGLGRITAYSIELSYSRAEEAERLLDHALATGFENAVLTDLYFIRLKPPVFLSQ